MALAVLIKNKAEWFSGPKYVNWNQMPVKANLEPATLKNPFNHLVLRELSLTRQGAPPYTDARMKIYKLY